MPGDGIGNQVLPESLRVLKAVGFDAEYIHADIGWDCWCAQGNALPDRTMELLTKHKLGLFGAIAVLTAFGMASLFRIDAIPAMLIFKNARLADKLVGLQPKQSIVQRLEAAARA